MDFYKLQAHLEEELQNAALKPGHPWRSPVLATLSLKGPQQRILILRGFSSQDWQLHFYTDYRSTKVAELLKNNFCSLHFYNPESQVQLRLSGKVEVHNGDQIAEEHLAKIPENRRSDYQSSLAPGTVLNDNSSGESQASTNFTVLVFKPQSLDYLKLSTEGHLRVSAQYLNGNWYNWNLIQA